MDSIQSPRSAGTLRAGSQPARAALLADGSVRRTSRALREPSNLGSLPCFAEQRSARRAELRASRRSFPLAPTSYKFVGNGSRTITALTLALSCVPAARRPRAAVDRWPWSQRSEAEGCPGFPLSPTSTWALRLALPPALRAAIVLLLPVTYLPSPPLSTPHRPSSVATPAPMPRPSRRSSPPSGSRPRATPSPVS